MFRIKLFFWHMMMAFYSVYSPVGSVNLVVRMCKDKKEIRTKPHLV